MDAVENFLASSKHIPANMASTSSVNEDVRVDVTNDENLKDSNMDHPSAKRKEKEAYEKDKEEIVKENEIY